LRGSAGCADKPFLRLQSGKGVWMQWRSRWPAAQVQLKLHASLSGPITLGFWRPVVILPAALLSGLPVDLLEALLAHELAHIRRWDYLVNLLQSLVEGLLFFHPVVWWLSRRMRIEREQVADELGALTLRDPSHMALALHALSLQSPGRQPDWPCRPVEAHCSGVLND
jgi:D-alanyl-D-alanine endopeptidase (penicillin-binding protein 7)